MEIIQSRQNPLFKSCLKLATQRRERLKSGLTLLDGPHLLAAALDTGLQPERTVVAEHALAKNEVVELSARLVRQPVVFCDTLFAELTELESASGLLAIWSYPSSPKPSLSGMILALDGVQDPGNVGSILRTAAAAGVDQVWLGQGCADVWSPKVLRAGMGAHFCVPVIERVELPALAAVFSGRRAVTVLAESSSLYQTDLRGDLLLIMGSEGQGVQADLVKLADLRLRVPMHRGMESLNVGAATAICLYERLRQVSG
ncbi:RNA methyltransferase [Chitinimonas sp. BJYL2]|uniref:TrmH family RNA methyltransferase n=1 Tax=Chitinimonas sp. BJYL2 TaxID=2976696 RepID=UPI0022B36090|nr:RNA methyltransferase [Chitinimonas sp. BJYL2]